MCVSAVSDVMSDKGEKESDKADNLEDILDEDDDNVDQEAVAKELDEAGEEAIDALLEDDDDDDVEDKEVASSQRLEEGGGSSAKTHHLFLTGLQINGRLIRDDVLLYVLVFSSLQLWVKLS